MISEWVGFKNVSLFSAIVFAIAINAISVRFIKPIVTKEKKSTPQNDDFSNLNAVITSEISGGEGDYGKIKFRFKNKEFEMNALSANPLESALQRNFKVGEQVVIVLESDGVCFVCSQNDLFLTLDEMAFENAHSFENSPENSPSSDEKQQFSDGFPDD